MSLDSSSVERLLQLQTFLDFIENPSALTKILQDLKATTETYKQAAQNLQDGKDFLSWKNQIQKNLDAESAALDAQAQALQANIDNFEAVKTDTTQAFEARDQKINAALNVIAQKEKAIASRVAAIEPQEKEIALLQQRLADKEADLQAREAALADKTAKLQSILG